MDRHLRKAAAQDPAQQPRTDLQQPQLPTDLQTDLSTAAVAPRKQVTGNRPNRGAAAAKLRSEQMDAKLLSDQLTAMASAQLHAANVTKRKRTKLIAKRSARKTKAAAAKEQEPTRIVVHAAPDCMTMDQEVLADHDAANADVFKSPTLPGGTHRTPKKHSPSTAESATPSFGINAAYAPLLATPPLDLMAPLPLPASPNTPIVLASLSREPSGSKKKPTPPTLSQSPSPPSNRLTRKMRKALVHRPPRKRCARVSDFIPDSPPRGLRPTKLDEQESYKRSVRRRMCADRLARKEELRAWKATRQHDGIVDEDADTEAAQAGIITDEDGLDYDETPDSWDTDENVSWHTSDEDDDDWDEGNEITAQNEDEDDDDGNEEDDDDEDDGDEDDEEDDDESDSDDSSKSHIYVAKSPPPGDSSGYATPASPSLSINAQARHLKAMKTSKDLKEKAKEAGRQDERAAGGMLSRKPENAVLLSEDLRKNAERVEANNALHDERVIALIVSGFNPKESIEALKKTKEGGMESTQRAAEWLRVVSSTPLSNMSKAIGKAQQVQSHHQGQLAAQGQRSQYGPRVCDLVTRVPQIKQMCIDIQSVHDKNDFGHASTLSGSIKTLWKTLVDRKLHHNHKATEEICQAVCEDCVKCKENHAKQRREVQQEEDKLLLQAHIHAPKPWAIGDSRRDHKLRRTTCSTCKLGKRTPLPGKAKDSGFWLYFCMDCDQGWHEQCEGFNQLEEWVDEEGNSGFLCVPCHLQRYKRKNTRAEATLVHSSPKTTSKWDQPPSAKKRKQTGWDKEKSNDDIVSGRGAALSERRPERRRGKSSETPKPDIITISDSSAGSLNATSQLLDTSASTTSTNVKINPYIMWEEAGAVTVKGKGKIETGTSAAAWEWFKKTNIPIRDTAKALKGNLGPLTNAISHTIQLALAGSMLNEPEVHPEPNMTETQINIWVEKDTTFSWFKLMSDELLIKIMNRLNASVNPEPFFRLIMPLDTPSFKDGDIYYPVTEFQTHCDKWISDMNALVAAGWQPGTSNLKEVFLASIANCSTIHDQAKREVHTDVNRLIAALRKWILIKNNEVASQKAAKAALKQKEGGQAKAPADEKEEGLTAKRVKALFTQFTKEQAKIGPPPTKAATPEEGKRWQCQQCGNDWPDDGIRRVRCRDIECAYVEHKDCNKKGKPWPNGLKPLSWRGYGQPYPPKQQAYFDRKDAHLMGGNPGGYKRKRE